MRRLSSGDFCHYPDSNVQSGSSNRNGDDEEEHARSSCEDNSIVSCHTDRTVSPAVRASIVGLCTMKGGLKKTRVTERNCIAFIEHCCVLYKSQEGRCALTGVEMTILPPFRRPEQVSIDRIDGTQGYILGNVRLVCRWANQARWKYSDDIFVVFIRAIRERGLQRCDLVGLDPSRRRNKPMRYHGAHDNATTAIECLRYMCKTTSIPNPRRRAELRSPGFLQHCIEIVAEHGTKCFISGEDMYCTSDSDRHDNPFSITILRLDKDKGYVPGNVVLACAWITHACGDFGVAESLEFLQKL